jgi:hypothetical protein
MACIAKPPVAGCPGPKADAPPRARCAFCKEIAGDAKFITARRGSIGAMVDGPASRAEVQGGWTDRAAAILRTMYFDFFNANGGGPPCEYAFCWAGSGARREACPYSDVDGFIVLAEGAGARETAIFLEASTEVGERLEQILEAQGAEKGFAFCRGGLNPLGVSKKRGKLSTGPLTGTALELGLILERNLRDPEEYIQHLVTGLCDAGLAFGSRRVARGLRDQVDSILGRDCDYLKSAGHSLTDKRRMALQKIKAFLAPEMAPPEPGATRFNVKENFYRVPQFLAQSLCWWYGLEGITTDQQIGALARKGIISRENQDRLKISMETPLKVRVKAHLHAKDEWDWVTTPNHVDKGQGDKRDLPLSPQEAQELRIAAGTVRSLRGLAQQFYDNMTRAHGERVNPFV